MGPRSHHVPQMVNAHAASPDECGNELAWIRLIHRGRIPRRFVADPANQVDDCSHGAIHTSTGGHIPRRPVLAQPAELRNRGSTHDHSRSCDGISGIERAPANGGDVLAIVRPGNSAN